MLEVALTSLFGPAAEVSHHATDFLVEAPKTSSRLPPLKQ
jgi:hypothetical protein